MDWTDRAEVQRKALGLQKRKVAQALGVSASTYSAAIGQRRRNPSSFSLNDLAAILKVPPLWLKEGINQGNEGMPSPLSLVEIPVRNVYASAGHGAHFENAEIIGRMGFEENWARQFSRNKRFNDLNIIYARGDSMDPTICDADQLLVHSGTLNIKTDGIFVLSYEDTLLVKRVAFSPIKGRLSLKSDNNLYENFHDLPADSVRLVGHVVWVGRALTRYK